MERIKHRVTHYWSHRAEGFEAQRLREFESEKKDRWLAEFRKYLPQGRPIRVLDIGTGTGFFACLMAEEGHEAIGIDLTPEMIDHAEHMAAVLGLDARFLHTNTAVHGDLGMVRPGDLVIILTKSGSTEESVALADLLGQREGVGIWLMSCQEHSALGERIANRLTVPLAHEGDPWNIMPNNSTTLFLMILQTLAMQLAERMNVTLDDFRQNHPGGAIGNRLRHG